MGKKVSQKEIEEKIRKSSGTMSSEADTRILAAAEEYYGKHPAAGETSLKRDTGQRTETASAIGKSEGKQSFRTGRHQLWVGISAVAVCAVLVVSVILGVRGVRKKQPVPGAEPTPTTTIITDPLPTSEVEKMPAWKDGDVYILERIAEPVMEEVELFGEGKPGDDLTWTVGIPGEKTYWFEEGIDREAAEQYCKKMEQRGFSVYENPRYGAPEYILLGHVSEKEDARECIVRITTGKPGYVYYCTSLGWPREGMLPSEAFGILQDINTRFMQYGWEKSSSSTQVGSPLQSELPVDVTPNGMYENVKAQLFVPLIVGRNGVSTAFFVLWEGSAIQLCGTSEGLHAAWSDLTGDGKPELVTIGPGMYSGRSSFFLYVYAVVDGRVSEVARTMYADYNSSPVFEKGEDGTLHVVGKNSMHAALDARVELTETAEGTLVTLWDNLGQLPFDADYYRGAEKYEGDGTEADGRLPRVVDPAKTVITWEITEEMMNVKSSTHVDVFRQLAEEQNAFASVADANSQYYNATPEGFYEVFGAELFKRYESGSGNDDYLLYGDKVILAADAIGDRGILSMAVADVDRNGVYELYYVGSSGSGMSRETVYCFQPVDGSVTAITQEFLYPAGRTLRFVRLSDGGLGLVWNDTSDGEPYLRIAEEGTQIVVKKLAE